jgi:hypothetical protein
MRYVIVSDVSHLVLNAIELDAEQTLELPEGEFLMQSDTANIGATYIAVTNSFSMPTPAAPPLDYLKERAITTIDNAAGAERGKYITVTAGQEMTYQEKVHQAQGFQADVAPDATKYPMIYGEVGITAASAAEVAATVLQSFGQWQVIGARIERARLKAKRDVTAAQSAAEIDVILAAIDWAAA